VGDPGISRAFSTQTGNKPKFLFKFLSFLQISWIDNMKLWAAIYILFKNYLKKRQTDLYIIYLVYYWLFEQNKLIYISLNNNKNIYVYLLW
jgi:hypothetical protein